MQPLAVDHVTIYIYIYIVLCTASLFFLFFFSFGFLYLELPIDWVSHLQCPSKRWPSLCAN